MILGGCSADGFSGGSEERHGGAASPCAENWQHDLITDYGTYTGLPAIEIATMEAEPEVLDNSVERHDCVILLRLEIGDIAGLEYHRSPDNTDGLLYAIEDIEFNGTFITQNTTAARIQDDIEGGQADQLIFQIIGDLYVSAG